MTKLENETLMLLSLGSIMFGVSFGNFQCQKKQKWLVFFVWKCIRGILPIPAALYQNFQCLPPNLPLMLQLGGKYRSHPLPMACFPLSLSNFKSGTISCLASTLDFPILRNIRNDLVYPSLTLVLYGAFGKQRDQLVFFAVFLTQALFFVKAKDLEFQFTRNSSLQKSLQFTWSTSTQSQNSHPTTLTVTTLGKFFLKLFSLVLTPPHQFKFVYSSILHIY